MKLTRDLLEQIQKHFPFATQDLAALQTLHVNAMRFEIEAWYVGGLGHVSVMTATGFFGLMKMDTMIIQPVEVDMPLLSYDRVIAMGNDTLIFELYDTFENPQDLPLVAAAKADAEQLPDHDLGSHWYDTIKLGVSMAKKGKKAQSADFNHAAQAYLQAYLQTAAQARKAVPATKRAKASVYVEGLLTHGGPSTDVFLKALGKEKTARLFRTVLFGTK